MNPGILLPVSAVTVDPLPWYRPAHGKSNLYREAEAYQRDSCKRDEPQCWDLKHGQDALDCLDARYQEVVGQAVLSTWKQRLNRSLLRACRQGDIGTVQAALQQRGNPNTATADSAESALHLAAVVGPSSCSASIVQALLQAHAAVDVQDGAGRSPLQVALAVGHASSALLLQQAGATTDSLQAAEALSTCLYGCLSQAAQPPSEDEVAVVGFLTQLTDGETTKHMIFKCIARHWIGGLTALLAVGVDPNAVDPLSKRRAREFADAILNVEAVADLDAFGATCGVQDGHPGWALCLAAARGDARATRHWCTKADVNCRDTTTGSSSFTPLMYAATEGYYQVCAHLVENLANINLKDQQGRSAVTLARLRGWTKLADYLQDPFRGRGRPTGKLGGKNEGQHRKADQGADGGLDIHRLVVSNVAAKNLHKGHFQFGFNPMVTIRIDNQKAPLPAQADNTNPVWEDDYEFKLHDINDNVNIVFTMWDEDGTSILGSDLLGRVDLYLDDLREELLAGRAVHIDQIMSHQKSKDYKGRLQCDIALAFLEV